VLLDDGHRSRPPAATELADRGTGPIGDAVPRARPSALCQEQRRDAEGLAGLEQGLDPWVVPSGTVGRLASKQPLHLGAGEAPVPAHGPPAGEQ
jgi:hypothetical protein